MLCCWCCSINSSKMAPLLRRCISGISLFNYDAIFVSNIMQICPNKVTKRGYHLSSLVGVRLFINHSGIKVTKGWRSAKTNNSKLELTKLPYKKETSSLQKKCIYIIENKLFYFLNTLSLCIQTVLLQYIIIKVDNYDSFLQ